MKNMTPVLVDRLARALKAQGIDLKRGKLIEISASMLGFHNSNEMQAAGSRGELVPAAAEPIGRLAMPDGTTVVAVRDADSGAIFGYDPAALSRRLIDAVVVAPYGGLSRIEGIDVDALPTLGRCAAGGSGGIDADLLGTLIEAADAHAETLRGDLTDDDNPDECAGRFLDEIEDAVRKVRENQAAPVAAEAPVIPTPHLGDFRMVHKDVLSSLVGAASSYADDLSSGMEDGTYQDEDNADRLYDINQAIGAAEAAEADGSADQQTDASTPKEIAQILTDAITADVWDDDAAARRDADAVQEMAGIKQAMLQAASILRTMKTTDVDAAPKPSDASSDEPAWTTDVEADVIYGVTREDLEGLGLRYGMQDGEWLPLTDEEFSYLQPGWPGATDRNFMWTPDGNGLEVRMGQSCVWKGQKWLVPSIEFAFDDEPTGRTRARAELDRYVRDLGPMLDQLGGSIVVNADATDYAHEIDVFIPMELAISFDSTENWAKALAWLLCPTSSRERLVRVMATIRTPVHDTCWDATFDVLKEGMAKAIAYIRGDQDDDLTMRYCESPLAHKDADEMWNQNWEMELDVECLAKLFDIKLK